MSNTSGAPANLKLRLSLMMLFQYAIWGAWLPLLYPYLTEHLGFTDGQFGMLAAIGALGAIVAPFLSGQIADRWMSTEKFLGISHILGAVLVWQLATLETYNELVAFSLLYSLIYAPTLSLTNSLAFHHLPDRDRDFGKVRVWGTIGWILVGIGIGQWLAFKHTPDLFVTDQADPRAGTESTVRALQVAGMADAFRLSAILGAVLGLFCFTLPHTPPQKGEKKFAPAEVLNAVVRKPALRVLFIVALPIAIVHQFYFVRTAGFLGHLDVDSPFIDAVFGVGGGGIMTIGQIVEIAVLAVMPLIATKVSRKALLSVGLLAYTLRFAVFAWLPEPAAVLPALALHGLCFGCFFFIAFMVVDEETDADARASAQGFFNFVMVGLGVILGNLFAGYMGDTTKLADDSYDYATLFGVPAAITAACLLAHLVLYPRRSPAAA